MSTTLKNAVVRYLRTGSPAVGTRKEYFATLRKWTAWGGGMAIEKLSRREIRDFLDWVYERAVEEEGINPGRTANKARENIRAIMSWAWERDIIDVLPRFPKPRPQRNVAGRHYLTKAEINALYFATHRLQRPRGWDQSVSVGRYCARRSSCSSTMALTPERFGLASQAMNQSFGNTSPGTLSLRTVTSNSSRVGDGSSIVA